MIAFTAPCAVAIGNSAPETIHMGTSSSIMTP